MTANDPRAAHGKVTSQTVSLGGLPLLFVASRFLTMAGGLAALGGAGMLLAAVEVENTAARRLLHKTGFRPLPATGSSGAPVLVRDLRSGGGCLPGGDDRSQRKEPWPSPSKPRI